MIEYNHSAMNSIRDDINLSLCHSDLFAGINTGNIASVINNITEFFTEYSGIFTVSALLISFWSLKVAIKALNLKCGTKVIGYYNIARSFDSNTPYVREVVIQNLKDKEVAIHEIYIRFGKNVYLDLFDKGCYDYYVHILPPLGTLQFKFGPAYRYSCGLKTVDMSNLIWGKKQGQLVLVTNIGKIMVKRIKTGWSPHGDYFRNFGIQIIQMHKYYTTDSLYGNNGHKTKAIDYSSYGDRIVFLVTLKINGKDIEYSIFGADETQVSKFKRLKFTKQVLQDERTLRSFLNSEKKRGNIKFDSIVKIINFKNLINKAKNESDKYGYYTPKVEKWFDFYILDKAQTIWLNFKNDYDNYQKENKHYNYHCFLFNKWIKHHSSKQD